MQQPQVHVAVAAHSGFGHTRRQAEAVARGAAGVPQVAGHLLDVADLSDAEWATLDRADAIIFGAPTYMGSPSAAFKAFAEETSKAWGDGLRWKDKLAAGFTNSQGINGDKLNSLVSFAILAAQHGMHWISLGLYPGWSTSSGSADDLNRLGSYLGAMAQSHGDQGPDVAPRESDLQTAEELGRRVALAAQRWVRGQEIAERAAAA
jgi:NAD(P)H dehydrogenase (quinone)